jgi:uncharacterized membrane protein/predicted DsbA family dithiol-disulfide isomerase
MRVQPTLFLFRLAATVALSVSLALLLDYLKPKPSFCSLGSSCETVIFSKFGQVLGVPLPLLGVATFGTLLIISLVPGARMSRGLVPLSLLAGAGGLGLLLIQFLVLQTVCPLCLVADICALVTGVVGLFWVWRPPALTPGKPMYRFWIPLAFVAVAGPLDWSRSRSDPPLPPQVAAQWVPGKVTVVEVIDFACPSCRRTHAVLQQVMQEYGDRVHWVHFTLPRLEHEHAHEAARAFLCAQRQGKGPAMAAALCQAESLTSDACTTIAAKLGLSLLPYQTCIINPDMDARISKDRAWIEALPLRGLPGIWIQDQFLLGEQSAETFRAAVQRAEKRRGKLKLGGPK